MRCRENEYGTNITARSGGNYTEWRRGNLSRFCWWTSSTSFENKVTVHQNNCVESLRNVSVGLRDWKVAFMSQISFKTDGKHSTSTSRICITVTFTVFVVFLCISSVYIWCSGPFFFNVLNKVMTSKIRSYFGGVCFVIITLQLSSCIMTWG